MNKHITKKIGVVLFMLILPISQIAAQEADIIELIETWWSGWAQKDTSVFIDMADEHFIEFTGSHTQRSEGKEKLLQIAEAVFPLLKLEEFKIENPRVVFHGNTAICHYYFVEHGKFNGKEYSSAGCATGAFVKKEGKWKLVSHHRTKFNKSINY